MMESFESGLKVIWNAMNDHRGVLLESSRFKCLLFILHLYQNRVFREKLARTEGQTCFAERLAQAVQETDNADVSGKSHYLMEVFDSYRHYFDGCPRYTRVWDRFIEAISSVPDEWYAKNYPAAFETILERIVDGERRDYGEFIQPATVTKLVADLLGYEGKGSVYNPYAGLASYAIEMNTLSDYHGEEINPETRALGMIRLAVHGIDPESLSVTDSYQLGFDSGRTYDYVVATPPFPGHISPDDKRLEPDKSPYIEHDFLYRGSQLLSPNGKLAGVFPIAFTCLSRDNQEAYNLRKYLVDEQLVSTVILLPDGLFSNQKVVIVLDKSIDKDGIKFIDASTLYFKENRRTVLDFVKIKETMDCTKAVAYDKVASNGYSLLPSRYTDEYDDYENIPEGYVGIDAKDVLQYHISDCITSSQKGDMEGIHAHMLTFKDLTSVPFADPLSADKLPIQDISEAAGSVCRSCAFIRTVGPLRPTYVSVPEGMTLYYGRNIVVLDVDETEIYGTLFLYEWARKANKLMKGSALPRVDINAALELMVVIPETIPEQKALYERMRREYKEARAKELGLEEVIASQRRDFIYTFRGRKHNLGNLLGDVRNNVSVLSKFISAYGLKDKPVIPNATRTVSEHIEKLNSLLNGMYEQISHLLDEELFGDPEKIDLAEKLKKIPSDVNYTVEYSADLGSLPQHGRISLNPTAYVSINARNLDSVIENIIGNAVKHGFNGERGHKIGIDLSFDGTDQMYVVVFKNDGRPMPEGFDTVRYGIEGEKGVDSDGHGQGGAIVKGIVEHFGGRIEVVNDPNAMYPVEIIIKLPKYDGD